MIQNLAHHSRTDTLQSGLTSTLEAALRDSQTANLGIPVCRDDIICYPGQFSVFPDLKVLYPRVVLDCLEEIYAEYNSAFEPLVLAAKQAPTDYQYCCDANGRYTNYMVQIDMLGLPPAFLNGAADAPKEVLRDILRRCIFEVENSLAGYDLLQNLFASKERQSFFSGQFRRTLTTLKRRLGKPIALLAVTEEKYQLMRSYEFGLEADQQITPSEVFNRTGFDAFFGPTQFAEYFNLNGGRCDYLLYVRASSPTSKLKDPTKFVSCPLLDDSRMRKVIREHAITFNVDDPTSSPQVRLNDTKQYLRAMDLAFAIPGESGDPFAEVFAPEFSAHLQGKGAYSDYALGNRLSPRFKDFLERQGVTAEEVELGRRMLRFKPERESYGAYGHIRMCLPDRKKKRDLRVNLSARGDYLVQPELETPVIEDSMTQARYTYIDRNFFSMISTGEVNFMGGYRTLMRTNSYEASQGRIHGSEQTVWAEILPER